jgi:hypothetical protein
MEMTVVKRVAEYDQEVVWMQEAEKTGSMKLIEDKPWGSTGAR